MRDIRDGPFDKLRVASHLGSGLSLAAATVFGNSPIIAELRVNVNGVAQIGTRW
jgi:hypothetical protein